MARSRVVQGAVGLLSRHRGCDATSTSYCSVSSTSDRTGLDHFRCCSSASIVMVPSSASASVTASSPLARVPPKTAHFNSFASRRTCSTFDFASRGTTAASETETLIRSRRSDRGYSSTPSSSTSTSSNEENHHLDEATFHAAADETLHDLVDVLESWVDEEVENDEADVEYSSGVLTLRLGEGKGTYVINKQAPNRQLWLSSPVSGPVRYDLVSPEASSSSSDSSRWIYHRDGHEMRARLREELAGMFGRAPEGL